MARGWESKSVESQIADRENRGANGPRKSREELSWEQKRQSLELSKRRIARELERATTPAHRTALENALRYLEQELADRR